MALKTRYFDEIEIGDELEEQATVDRDDVLRFFEMTASASAGANGDNRFIQEEAGRRLGAEGPIVPGVMSFAMLSRLVTDWMGADGQVDALDISFRRPISHGDPLKLVALATDTDEDAGSVKLDVYMENQRGERPLQGTAIIRLPRRS